MLGTLARFFRERDGQGLAEYGLLIVLIGILCLAALDAVGVEVVDLLTPISDTLGSASS